MLRGPGSQYQGPEYQVEHKRPDLEGSRTKVRKIRGTKTVRARKTSGTGPGWPSGPGPGGPDQWVHCQKDHEDNEQGQADPNQGNKD